MKLISLTTDFGLSDTYVAEMKARILSLNGLSQALLDVTHEIADFDIQEAAYRVAAFAKAAPKNTVHLVVVDPGVGSNRARLVAQFQRGDGPFWLVAPDNGVLSILEKRYPEDASFWVIHSRPLQGVSGLQLEALPKESQAPTFDGREVFAPVAAYLAQGGRPEDIGTKTEQIERFQISRALLEKGRLRGEVLYFDSYGNATTSIVHEELADKEILNIRLSEKVLRYCSHFQELRYGELGCLINSQGHLEIVLRCESAQRSAGLKKGSEIVVEFA